MLMFVTCAHCQHDIEERGILDIALFLPWKCPKCERGNSPLCDGLEAEKQTGPEQEADEEEITVESGDLTEEDYKNNILEGLK